MRALRNVALGVCTTLLGALLTTAAAAPALADPLDPVDSVEVSAEQQSIAPGVSLEHRTTLDTTGPVRSSLLRLSAGSTTTPRLLQQDLSSPRTPADLATAAGAVAAVNGDFFDIDRTGTPDGPVVLDGTPLKADAQPQTAVGVDAGASGWVGRLGQVLLQGSASLGGRTFPLAALGTRTVPADSLALFTPAWGSGDRALTAPTGIELEVRSGRISAVRPPGPTPVPGDGFVLVATGTVATALAGTALGTPATTDLQVRDDALTPGSRGFALGARLELLHDGAVTAIDTTDPTWAALRARTALGWSAGGDLLLLTIDGGTSRSRGVTAVETAQRMVQAGARGAVMLDGGGSAQLVARRPGEAGVSEVAVPSDGAARPVANAIGLVPAAAAPVAASIVLRGNGSPTRLFPGLTGLVAAVPVNSAGAPVPGTAVVTSTDGAVATVEGSRVRGTAPGLSSLRASLGGAVGSLDVEVMDPLRRVDLETPTVLDGPGAVADVTLVGRDAEGRSAPLSAADVTVATDPAALRADPLPDGRLRLTALAAGPTSVDLRLSAAGLTSTATVGVGTRPVLLDALDDPASWTPSATRATASLRRVDVPDLPGVAAALRLDYDFTGQPAGTSTAALVARTPLPLPSGSREVVLQVRGDGQGGWLRGQLVVDGALRPVTFASRVDFTGWRTVRVPVPAGARSVALERIYLAQTSVAARRAGSLDVAALQATVPPVATTGSGAPDPALGPLAATGPRTARVAVVSGTSVSAARPSSAEHLAGELRRVVAAGAQRIVLAGDVVGSAAAPGTAQDVDLVRAVLARSLPPTVSWTWTAGDGEVGTPAAGGFSSAGPPATAVDVAGTRFVSVATRAGTIRGADAHALTRVRDDLAAAGAASRSVVLVSAGPLTDPDESVLLGRWTEALRARGVRVAVVEGGAPAGVRRDEEVLRVGTANAAVLSVAADQAGLPATARAAAPGTDDGWLRLQASGPLVDRYERDVR